MREVVVVREYARLTTSTLERNSLDEAQISETAFDWLCELAGRFRTNGANLLQIDGRLSLRLDNFVGVLESPCGQVIEILPKHVHDEGIREENTATNARRLLCRLIESALHLPARMTEEAGLQLYRVPVSEWVMRQFLLALDHLLKRGLRFDYLRLEEEQKYLRGQLDVVRQLRQPPHKQYLFQIRHDVFLPDRPENRLLKSALDVVVKNAQQSDNWRLAHELAGMLHELPSSQQINQDFKRWRNDRLMEHYQPIKPWCELILRQHMPLAVHGSWRGISFLFPMERLFEHHVEQVLLRQLVDHATLTGQAGRYSLCTYQGRNMFQMKPDLLLEHAGKSWVLDAKWKRLDVADLEGKFGLSQPDFYQLFAYGQYYQQGKGDVLLIYPKWYGFQQALPPFTFQWGGIRAWAVPFDLETDELLLPAALNESLPLQQCVYG